MIQQPADRDQIVQPEHASILTCTAMHGMQDTQKQHTRHKGFGIWHARAEEKPYHYSMCHVRACCQGGKLAGEQRTSAGEFVCPRGLRVMAHACGPQVSLGKERHNVTAVDSMLGPDARAGCRECLSMLKHVLPPLRLHMLRRVIHRLHILLQAAPRSSTVPHVQLMKHIARTMACWL